MGMLIDGEWIAQDGDRRHQSGRYRRMESRFRSWITPDGAPGPTGAGGFKAEPGRYHLYVSHACPWAHRTMIMRALKGLEDAVSVSVVHYLMLDDGWTFDQAPGAVPDTVNGARFLREIYLEADPAYTGRVSVPVLWDKETRTIVNNESSEIIRMFNSAFERAGANGPDYYPAPLRAEIDAVNEVVYGNINNGVYKCGFARAQDAYEEAFGALFAALDEMESRLARRRYLAGDAITEADWRLFTTLVRFDAVYHGHFKCNRRKLSEYENLTNYARELFQVPGVAETVDFDHIRKHYYMSQTSVNPTQIVAVGPEPQFHLPHNRG